MLLSNQKIKVLLADDEPAARHSMRILLQNEKDMELVAECSNGAQTAEAIISLKPDLVLLDIQMPEGSGFEVLEAVRAAHLPIFVFVTAYDRFALQAFEQSACDYLLKPYDDDRFYESINRARSQVMARRAQTNYQQLEMLLKIVQGSAIPEPPGSPAYPAKLVIKSNRKITFLDVDSIVWLESEGNFVKLHTTTGMKLGNYTFKQLQTLLHPQKFVRIHKSYMVNREFIEYLEPHFHGDYVVAMKGGRLLKLSRNYKDALDALLSGML